MNNPSIVFTAPNVAEVVDRPVPEVRPGEVLVRSLRSCVSSGTERANHGLRRQFLHSWRVSFDHPVTGELIACKDTLPADLLAILNELEPLSMGRTEAGERICPQLGA